MILTIPDEIITALQSASIDIEPQRGGVRIVLIERRKHDVFEIVDGYGVTLDDAVSALERNAAEWLQEQENGD